MLLTPEEWEVVGLSLKVALVAVAGLLPFGIAGGYWLARSRSTASFLVANLVQIPLVLPPVVTGVFLLMLLGPRGPVGALLDRAGIEIAFTWVGAALASAIVALPLMVQAVSVAFGQVERSWEEAGYVFGGTRWGIFRLVTLPLAARGIAAGLVLAFARALGEFGATIVLAGNIPGETQTISLAIYTFLSRPSGDAYVLRLAAVSVLLSVASMAAHAFLTRRLHDPQR